MKILILWFLLGLLVTKINAAVTTISAPTTLSGDQTFSDDIVIESGATLELVSGTSYSFNGNIDVKGTLDIIGDSTKGLTSLQFGSTTTITNSGNINIENIKSAGSASDFVISPASIDNSGTFTVSQLNAAATVPGTNFTLAPTGSFINTGTIAHDTADKGGTTNGFLHLGAITNNGVIKSGRFSGLINEESYLVPSRYDMKGIIFNNPLEGHGKVTGNDGAVILLNTGTLGEQTFDINHSMYIINPKVVPSSLNVKNSIGSMLVFLGVEYQSWNADNFGTSAEGQQINFAIDGHRYWFNTSCAGGWQQQNDPFVVTPSDSQYQIGGTFIYLTTFYYFPYCSQPITKTTTVTTEDLIIKATTISTITTSTTNQYGLTVTEIIYDVAVPAASTLSTTTTGDVTAPTTSTFTTIVTDNNGSSSTEVVVVITPAPSNSVMTSLISVSSPLYGNSTIPNEKTITTLSSTLVVLTTVINGVTVTTTYCPEPSEISRTSMTATIGHGSIESIYSKNQQEEINSFSAVFDATPVISIISTTASPTFTNNENQPTSRNSRGSTTVVGNAESGRPETSVPTMVSQVSQYVSEQFSSSPTAVTISHGSAPSLASYEGKGSTIYMKWSVAHFISLLLFMII